MSALFSKHSIATLLSLLLILALFATIWLSPSIVLPLGLGVLLFGLFTASFLTIKRNRESYLQGGISLGTSIRNICFEITIILLSMCLAGLFGRYFAELATRHMSNDFSKIVAGVCIGLLVGTLVGVFIKRASYYLIKTFPGR